MRLEDLTVALRPRQPWEAVDLGCALVRRDYGRILALWLICTVPLWGLLALLLRDSAWYFLLAVCWLKPAYGMLSLLFLSQAAFGTKPSLREVVRQAPNLGLGKLFLALTLRRFSPIRSLSTPVRLLEGQKGAAVRKRIHALAHDSQAVKVTAVFLLLEFVVAAALYMLASSFSTNQTPPDLSDLFVDPVAFFQSIQSTVWKGSLYYLLAMTLIEPFYIGAGFGLYLNARTRLEGWDIELTFRRLATRLASKGVMMTLLLLLCGSLGTASLSAQEIQPRPDSSPAGVEKQLAEIYARPEFKEHVREVRHWMSEETKSVKEDRSVSPSGSGTPAMGQLFYGLAIAGAALLLGWGIYWLVKNWHLLGFRMPAKPSAKAPRIVMGLDIAPESLPDDLVAAARAAWQAGHWREALSLLYRGSLSHLVEQQRLPIRDSDTEEDCLLLVARSGNETTTRFFETLTWSWIRTAYAGHTASAEEFEQLCTRWPFPRQKAARSGSPSASATALLLGGLSLLPLLLAGCYGKGHWETDSIPIGYRGAARTDPFLAAKALLKSYGHTVSRVPSLSRLPEENGVLFLSAENGMPEAQAARLLSWVSEGNHLVYFLAGGAPYNDWGMLAGFGGYAYGGNDERPDPILTALGVKPNSGTGSDSLAEAINSKLEQLDQKPEKGKKKAKKKAAGKTDTTELTPETVPTSRNQIRLHGEVFQVDFPTFFTLSLDRKLRSGETAAGDAAQTTFLGLKQGYGRVTVFTHARPIRNRYLDENDHARWLLHLTGAAPQTVQFIITQEADFWQLLKKRAWMPLVGLALLAVLWLWKSIPRFGPVRQVELHGTKQFAEHIGALGQFFYRVKRADVLVHAAAQALRMTAYKQHPHLANHDDELLVDLLAGQSPLPKERIRKVLQPPAKAASNEVVQQLQDLQSLRTALSYPAASGGA